MAHLKLCASRAFWLVPDKGRIAYDWQHYIPLVQRKPGALRNGAPFMELPESLQRLRRALLRQDGGDRLMAKVLALVPQAGLEAVLVAVELALEGALAQATASTKRRIKARENERSAGT